MMMVSNRWQSFQCSSSVSPSGGANSFSALILSTLIERRFIHINGLVFKFQRGIVIVNSVCMLFSQNLNLFRTEIQVLEIEVI